MTSEDHMRFGVIVRDSLFATLAEWKEGLGDHRMLVVEHYCRNLIDAPAMPRERFALGAEADRDTFLSMYVDSKPELTDMLMQSFDQEALAVVACAEMMPDLHSLIGHYFNDALALLEDDITEAMSDALRKRYA